jgi:hypothetical protein
VTRETGILVSLLARPDAAVGALTPDDWERVATLAAYHDVAPVLHRRLGQKGLVSGAPTARLRDASRASAARNLLLMADLGKILRAVQAGAIPLIPLKGAYLAEAVYRDIALRPMADLDLLVKPADLPRAIETLRGLGYESDQPFDPVAQQDGFQDMPPMRRPGGAMVELHWTLVTPLCDARIDEHELAGLWERSLPATIAGAPSRALAAEDLLLHLCMHASVHHRFADIGLKAFVDMAEVIRHHEGTLDWGAFTDRANRWRVANGTRMALRLAEEWTGLRVPAEAWNRLDGPAPDERTLEWARHKVLEGRPTELVGQFAGLEAHSGAGGRLSTLRRAAFPSLATMARDYGVPGNSWRVLAYYPYRFWDLWKRYRGAMWKLLKGDAEFVAATRNEARLREYLGWR